MPMRRVGWAIAGWNPCRAFMRSLAAQETLPFATLQTSQWRFCAGSNLDSPKDLDTMNSQDLAAQLELYDQLRAQGRHEDAARVGEGLLWHLDQAHREVELQKLVA